MRNHLTGRIVDESMMGRNNDHQGRATCFYLLHTGEPELRIAGRYPGNSIGIKRPFMREYGC